MSVSAVSAGAYEKVSWLPVPDERQLAEMPDFDLAGECAQSGGGLRMREGSLYITASAYDEDDTSCASMFVCGEKLAVDKIYNTGGFLGLGDEAVVTADVELAECADLVFSGGGVIRGNVMVKDGRIDCYSDCAVPSRITGDLSLSRGSQFQVDCDSMPYSTLCVDGTVSLDDEVVFEIHVAGDEQYFRGFAGTLLSRPVIVSKRPIVGDPASSYTLLYLSGGEDAPEDWCPVFEQSEDYHIETVCMTDGTYALSFVKGKGSLIWDDVVDDVDDEDDEDDEEDWEEDDEEEDDDWDDEEDDWDDEEDDDDWEDDDWDDEEYEFIGDWDIISDIDITTGYLHITSADLNNHLGGSGTTPKVHKVTGVRTVSAAQLADPSWFAWLSEGGVLDVSRLGDGTELTDSKLMGDGGTLVLGGKQTMSISKTQVVGYSVLGVGDYLGGHVRFSGPAEWVLAGSCYRVQGISVSQGKLTIAKNTVVGRVPMQVVRGVKGQERTSLRVQGGASVTNDGAVYAGELEISNGGVYINKSHTEAVGVQVQQGSALFNEAEFSSQSLTVAGALNNSGTLHAGNGVIATGTVYNSGTISSPVMVDGGLFELIGSGHARFVQVGQGGTLCGASGYVDSLVIMRGGYLGSTDAPCGINAGSAMLADGSVLRLHISPASKPMHVNQLMLDGAVSLEIGVEPGFAVALASCSQDGSFRIKALEAAERKGDGYVDATHATVTGGEISGSPEVHWEGDTLTVSGKVDEDVLSRFVRKDVDRLSDTLWSGIRTVEGFLASVRTSRACHSQSGSVWFSALGETQDVSGKGGEPGYKMYGGGFAVGAATKLAERTFAGAAVGYSRGKHDVGGGLLRDEMDTAMLGVYCIHEREVDSRNKLSFSADAVIAESENSANTRMNGLIPASASWDATVFACTLNATWECQVSRNVWVSPYATIGNCYARQEGFSENSAIGTRRYTGATANIWTAEIGAAVRSVLALGGEGCRFVSPYASVAYCGDFAVQAPHGGAMAAGREIRSSSACPDRSGAVMQVGADWRFCKSWTFGAFYRFDTRHDATAHAFGVHLMGSF